MTNPIVRFPRAGRVVLRAVLFAASLGALVVCGDPSVSRPAVAQDAAIVPPKPEGGEFAITSDGQFLPGRPSAVDEVAGTLTLPTGATVPLEKVALAYRTNEKGKSRRIFRGDDAGTYVAWAKRIEAQHIAKRGGAKKFDPTEAAARDLYRDAVVEAVSECTRWKCWTAAGALLGDALAMDVWDEKLQAAAIASIPDIGNDAKCEEDFPFTPEDEVRGREWAKWCRGIVMMGGRFPIKELATGYEGAQIDWKTNGLVIRSRNVELWSLERDKREAVCDVLSQCEATVRALEALFGLPVDRKAEPIVVRLYPNREAYLGDIGKGGKPSDWTAGFFSPSLGISHFYLGAKMELYVTLSHELTHHWIERRLHRGGDSNIYQPGSWIVEGFANYVGYQSARFQKGDFKFANTRNAGVMQTIAGRRHLFDCADLLAHSKEKFETSLTQDYTKLHMFYEQSSAIVFWMMNTRGNEGRAALLEYMRRYYFGEFLDVGPRDPDGRVKIDYSKGKPVPDTWKVLGFASASEMNNEFLKFLDGVNQ